MAFVASLMLTAFVPAAGADDASIGQTNSTTVQLAPPYVGEGGSGMYSGNCSQHNPAGPDCKAEYKASAADGTLRASLDLDTGGRGSAPRHTLSERLLAQVNPHLSVALHHSEELRRIDVRVPIDVGSVAMEHAATIGSSVAGAELWAYAWHPGCDFSCVSEVKTVPLGNGEVGLHTLNLTVQPPDAASLLPAGRLNIYMGLSVNAGLFGEPNPTATTPGVDPVRVPFSLPICSDYPWARPYLCMERLWEPTTLGGVASREVRKVQGFATSAVTATVPMVEVTLEGTTSPPAVSPPPVLTVSDAPPVAEGSPGAPGHTQGFARFRLSLSAPASESLDFGYQTVDGTAKTYAFPARSPDYEWAWRNVTFLPGETTKVVEVPVNMDTSFTDELPEEDFFLQVYSSSTAVVQPGRAARATIVEDDPASSALLSVSDATVIEGNEGTTQAIFTVSLPKPYAAPFTVRAVTADGTAHPRPHESNDYVHLNQTIRFERDEMIKQVAVTINGDKVDERDETFFLALEDSTGPQRQKRQGVGVITNDDGIPPMSIDDVAIAEGNAGPTEARFTISLGHSSFRPISVNYGTANATARSTNHGIFGPADYNPASGTVNFAPGETTKTVVVTVNGDTLKEQDEDFVVNLSNNVNAIAQKRVGVGSIRNDE